MAVIFGGIFVIASILAGFTMAGGKVAALIHLSEFITIGGASIGAMIIMAPKKVLMDLFRGMLQFLKGSWHYGELDAVKAFGDKFIMKQMGRGFVKIGGAETLGPILMGMSKPVHLLARGAEVEEIVNVTAIAVVDAQETASSVELSDSESLVGAR